MPVLVKQVRDFGPRHDGVLEVSLLSLLLIGPPSHGDGASPGSLKACSDVVFCVRL